MQGGETATVTDANVVLGYLARNSCSAAVFTLDREGAQKSRQDDRGLRSIST